jgi:hypothetical protein
MSIYINNFFVKNYEKLDYIPIASTLKSTKELFEKYVALPFRNSQATSEHNYSYLNNKPLLRCITLLIPVIGNILVGIYDFANRTCEQKEPETSQEELLLIVKKNPDALKDAPEHLKKDEIFMCRAFKENIDSIFHADNDLKNNEDFILEAFKTNPSTLWCASPNLKNSVKFMFKACKINPEHAFYYASEDLQKELIKRDHSLLEYASKQVQKELRTSQ